MGKKEIPVESLSKQELVQLAYQLSDENQHLRRILWMVHSLHLPEEHRNNKQMICPKHGVDFLYDSPSKLATTFVQNINSEAMEKYLNSRRKQVKLKYEG